MLPLDRRPAPMTFRDCSGKLWILAMDICLILNVSRGAVRQQIWKMAPDEKIFFRVNTPGGPQSMRFVSESGAVKILSQSRTETSVEVRKALQSLVLESTRADLISIFNQCLSAQEAS